MKTESSEVKSRIINGLKLIHGFDSVRHRKGEIGWIVSTAHWVALRWVYVDGVSGLPSEFIRLRNDVLPLLPKTFWPFPRPMIPKFELTILASEITQDFVEQLSQFASANAGGQRETFRWPLFDTASFHSFSYAWSVRAEARRRDYARQERRLIRRETCTIPCTSASASS